MRSGVIYRIHCRRTRQSYIGQTRQSVKSRWSQHIRSLNSGRHSADKLQRDWTKYGAKAFRFTVIESMPWCPQWWLNARERHWIGRLGYYNERHRHLYRGCLWHWMWLWIEALFGLSIGVVIHGLVFN